MSLDMFWNERRVSVHVWLQKPGRLLKPEIST
jgi:hypothetical protein